MGNVFSSLFDWYVNQKPGQNPVFEGVEERGHSESLQVRQVKGGARKTRKPRKPRNGWEIAHRSNVEREEAERKGQRAAAEAARAEEARREEEKRVGEAQETASTKREAWKGANEIRRTEESARQAEEAEREEAEREGQRAAAEAARDAARIEEQRVRLAEENTERYRQESEREKRKAEESASRARAAQEEAERVKGQAEETVIQAKAQQEASEEAEKAARQETQRAREAAEQAETKWRQGIQPIVWPTEDELQKAKERIGYVDGAFHFAVAGMGGSGKSSLINALRGMTDEGRQAAATGIVETTKIITGYRDPNKSLPFMWYDVPGAGSLKVPSWKYFHDKELYVFDSIIVLFDARFTETDIAILRNCALFKIPAYIVRSKSDQNMANVLKRIRREHKRNHLSLSEAELHEQARAAYADQTRERVKEELELAGLPLQRVYLVSQDVLCHLRKTKGQIVPGATAPDDNESSDDGTIPEEELQAGLFDEEKLLIDILVDAKNRRPSKQKEAMQSGSYNKLKDQMTRAGGYVSRKTRINGGPSAEWFATGIETHYEGNRMDFRYLWDSSLTQSSAFDREAREPGSSAMSCSALNEEDLLYM
ncbi:hypothetical protein HWV62_41699 [Athelia sp. TMB]|nr:hypothetical protein HWV62_41699 [Athelia sp. TMB]